jgi:hypothetical protein
VTKPHASERKGWGVVFVKCTGGQLGSITVRLIFTILMYVLKSYFLRLWLKRRRDWGTGGGRPTEVFIVIVPDDRRKYFVELGGRGGGGPRIICQRASLQG